MGEARRAADDDPTQDWPEDITPTAMWGPGSPKIRPGRPEAGAPAKGSLEISPTMPFEPLDAAAAKASLEISPTMPFVPMDMAAAKGPLEISPTMPFVPMEVAAAAKSMEISPTLPFVPMDLAVGKDLPEISPTMPFVLQEDKVPAVGDEAGAVPQGEEKPPVAAPEARSPKRSAAQLSENSPSSEEDESEAEDGAGVPLTEAERKRRRQEREWLRHKRRALRREEGLARQREAAGRPAAVGAGRLAAVPDLGAAAMSREEQTRFQALVADGPGEVLKGAAAVANRRGGLAALAGADDDDGFMLLGTFGGAPRKSRRLFGDRGAIAGS